MLTPDTEEKCTRDFTRGELYELRQLVRFAISERESHLENLEQRPPGWASAELVAQMKLEDAERLAELRALRRAIR